jgi:cytochrome c-type biogenesis protein CcmH/NrfG
MRWDMPAGKSNPSIFIELARKATELHPDNANGWELLGRSLLQVDRDEEAIAILTEAVVGLPAVANDTERIVREALALDPPA